MISGVSLLRGRLLVFCAIAMSALVLRVAVTSFSPLAAQISEEIGFSSTVVGVFGMIPTAMFAAFGLATPALGRRWGLERTALIAMLMAGVGMATRALMTDTWSLLLLSGLALGGMGIGNVVIPPLVKRYFSDTLALVSSVYIVGVQLSTIVPAFVAVPLADAFGWRVSLGVWALVGFAAAVPWVWVLLRHRNADAGEVAPVDRNVDGRVWRSPVGWGMVGMFGMTSLVTYSMFTWIPDILADAGASPAFGGAMVGLFALLGLVSAFGAPSLCARMTNPFPVVVACASCFLVAFAGLWIAPMSAPILWIVLLGLGPSTFPMALTLINLRSRSHAGSAALSGFTQGVGYTVACLGPLLFGVFHDLTSGWAASFAFMTVAVAVLVAGAYQACKPRVVEDSWNTRPISVG
ncbi:MFS transporter [Rhodococcus pyridinivorans]|uniref:MFS transporter n=2 Tax=Rhodococcus pyridinivorans TaxID=103816 RepID=A0A7M2XSD9_9NOCA|nr:MULTISPECIES: MFS transporter [Rhodococcus]AWZ24452.1 MFS transporter [Rhodococcus pyridinivorans]EHK82744.1 major facilitator superfamily cyanate symporter [Rhodococcus pyridinivorans AK37]KHJ74382.1 MFS transporter [Rhodococcus sp. Chr-9]MBX4170451.1 MFS transporter [Rhodococcus sp. DMU2021]MCD2141069.1 MFS transporter [Rhodococcus pyridinivorans]